MDSKLKDIIFITNYLTSCKLDKTDSDKSELTRKLLTCRVRQVLQERVKNTNCKHFYKKRKKHLFYFLTNLIF